MENENKNIVAFQTAYRMENTLRRLSGDESIRQAIIRLDPYSEIESAIFRLVAIKSSKEEKAMQVLKECEKMRGQRLDDLLEDGFDIEHIISLLDSLN